MRARSVRGDTCGRTGRRAPRSAATSTATARAPPVQYWRGVAMSAGARGARPTAADERADSRRCSSMLWSALPSAAERATVASMGASTRRRGSRLGLQDPGAVTCAAATRRLRASGGPRRGWPASAQPPGCARLNVPRGAHVRPREIASSARRRNDSSGDGLNRGRARAGARILLRAHGAPDRDRPRAVRRAGRGAIWTSGTPQTSGFAFTSAPVPRRRAEDRGAHFTRRP